MNSKNHPAGRRKRRSPMRRLVIIVILLILSLLLMRSCKKFTFKEELPSNGFSLSEKKAKDERILEIGTRKIPVKNMTVEFGRFDQENPQENKDHTLYAIPIDLEEEFMEVLESGLCYEQDMGHQLSDMPENYMILTLNPHVTLDITCKEEFFSGAGETLQGEKVPPGEYQYFNFYDSTLKMEDASSLFLSEENIVKDIESFIDKHRLIPISPEGK